MSNALLSPVMDSPEPHGALRLPPHSAEAESSVLGGLLLDNSAWDRMGDVVRAEDFYRHDHRLIFESIETLVNAAKPADVITVHEHELRWHFGYVGWPGWSVPWEHVIRLEPVRASFAWGSGIRGPAQHRLYNVTMGGPALRLHLRDGRSVTLRAGGGPFLEGS
ncbi:MAG: DnaB-like helicase N-terminal domain-containing protein, partial [Burkholderiaceae bacterium]